MNSRIIKRKIRSEYEIDVQTFIETEYLVDENGEIWYKQLSRNLEDRRSMKYNRIYCLFNITETVQSLNERNGSTLVWPTGLNHTTITITNNKPIKGFKPYNKINIKSAQVFIVAQI